MKLLHDIIYGVKIIKIINDINLKISSLQFDSREISQNDMFFAIAGYYLDGHNFINQVILEKGVKVIVCKYLPNIIYQQVTYLQVQDVSYSLGIISRNFYNNPSLNFKLIAITGTNGKTTCVTLLYKLFCKLGFICGLISTVENRIADEIIEANHTTPDIISLNKLFVKAKHKGCQYIFMEASSHGIKQNRLIGISIDILGFTNISHDHLDYHKTFNKYLKVKKKLFDSLSQNSIAIVNVDDKNFDLIIKNCVAKKKFYSFNKFTDYKGIILKYGIDYSFLEFNGLKFYSSLIGNFNGYNMLLVFAIASELTDNALKIIKNLSAIHNVIGRFEKIISVTNITIIIDYAHTPDALENVLKTINSVRTGKEKLFTIFGCGGNRDKTKRPKMGKIAIDLSNKVIITSDNPRNENINQIVYDIISKIDIQNVSKYIVIFDRKTAIEETILLATSGDIILIAGKGHEKYQEINGIKYYFDDLAISKKILKKLNK